MDSASSQTNAPAPVPAASAGAVALLEVFEAGLSAQLNALRRLRRQLAGGDAEPPSERGSPAGGAGRKRKKGRSQVDLALDILRDSPSPLHVLALIEGIKARFGVDIDRESLVSALSKRVARGDRFTRPAPNTFAAL